VGERADFESAWNEELSFVACGYGKVVAGLCGCLDVILVLDFVSFGVLLGRLAIVASYL
jgi:hypothetical protein